MASSFCRCCGKGYRPGRWKWSVWYCLPCVKAAGGEQPTPVDHNDRTDFIAHLRIKN